MEIKNIDNFKQCLDFSGLRDGSWLATDFDCVMEFQDKLFLIIEIKHFSNSNIPVGQRIALERFCRRLNSNTSRCFILVGEHNTPNNEIIDICKTKLVKYLYRSDWETSKKGLNILEAVNILKNKYLKGDK